MLKTLLSTVTFKLPRSDFNVYHTKKASLLCRSFSGLSYISHPLHTHFKHLNMTTRYAEAHKDTKGPGDARPTALQIIKDEDLEGKWKDKVRLLTSLPSLSIVTFACFIITSFTCPISFTIRSPQSTNYFPTRRS